MKKTISAICILLTIALLACAQDTKIQEGLALKYVVQMPAEKSAHPPVIIILHGYGSDEQDMFSLRNVLPKNYIIIAARAPYPLPGGGYEWFEKEMVNNKFDGRKEQFENSRNLIVKFIGQVVHKYNVDAKAVYLSGFSQGAIMSYEVGLTNPSVVKGIGVLSGVLPPSLKPLIKNTAALKQLKIFIAHGTADERLSYADGLDASNYLKSLGLNPEFHKYDGMPHTITANVISDFVNWLRK